MSRLVVRPEGGLCNRMRVIASSALLGRRLGVPVEVHWYATFDCNAPYSMLFEPAPAHFTVVEHRETTTADKIKHLALERAMALGGTQLLTGKPGVAFAKQVRQGHLPDARRPIYLRTFERLEIQPGMYRMLQPTGEVRARVQTIGLASERTVGVHIRRQDNVKAIAFSPLDGFVSAMRGELQHDPMTRFFLATDDPQTQQTLVDQFGDRIVTYRKRALDRNQPDALVDAAVDLYALASCRKLIGSFYSSFTDTAWEINTIPYVIVGEPAPATA